MPRVRATTAPIDYVTLSLLLVVILTGIAPTIGIDLLGHGYNYRTTVAPWFRGLFIGSPDVQPIAHAPFIYQLHATAAWMIWGLWPFSPARLELPTVVPVAALHRLPQPPAPPPSRVPAAATGARSVPQMKPSRSSSCVGCQHRPHRAARGGARVPPGAADLWPLLGGDGKPRRVAGATRAYSCARMTIAIRPPIRKKPNDVIRYRWPITL